MRKRRKILAGFTVVVMLTAVSVPAFGDELLADNTIKSGFIKAGVAYVIDNMDDILSENSVSKSVDEDIEVSSQSIVPITKNENSDVLKEITMNDVLKLAMITEGRVTLTDEERLELDLTGDHDITMADVVKASILASRVH